MIHTDRMAGKRPEGSGPDDPHPRLTRRWVQSALLAGRIAFEREMERDRRELDREFYRFWRSQRAGGA